MMKSPQEKIVCGGGILSEYAQCVRAGEQHLLKPWGFLLVSRGLHG